LLNNGIEYTIPGEYPRFSVFLRKFQYYFEGQYLPNPILKNELKNPGHEYRNPTGILVQVFPYQYTRPRGDQVRITVDKKKKLEGNLFLSELDNAHQDHDNDGQNYRAQ
jgi:hypothetical protein